MDKWDKITFRSDLSHYRINPKGEILSLWVNKVMKGTIDNNGYKTYNLKTDNGKVIQAKAHRFVAMQYIPNPEGKTVVNHIDENKINCNVDNLEWTTPKGNTNHGTCGKRKSEHQKKPVNEYTLEGKYIRTWKSARDVEKFYKTRCENGIQQSCTGAQFQAYGRIWRYYEFNHEDIEVKPTLMQRAYLNKGCGMSNKILVAEEVPKEYLYEFDPIKEKSYFINHERLTKYEKEKLKELLYVTERGLHQTSTGKRQQDNH